MALSAQYIGNEGRRVEAQALTSDNAATLSAWARAVLVEEIDPFDAEQRYPGLNVPCREGEGVKRASLGDYVVRHNDGGFDVLKPLEFHGSYWAVNL